MLIRLLRKLTDRMFARQEAARPSRDAHTALARAREMAAFGDTQAAQAALDEALGIHPVTAPVWNSAGIVRLTLRDLAGAQSCFESALELAPQLAEAHCNLGIALLELGLNARGEHHLREAITLDPGLLAARENLAISLASRFQHDAAVQAWNEVLALNPAHADAHAALGALSMLEGRFADARARHRRAVELGADPTNLELQQAGILAFEGDMAGAKRLYESLRGRADPADIRWGLALCALAQGNFAEGWPLYEARMDRKVESPRRPYAFPEWEGTALNEGILLILGEQGLGDEIMFASCYEDAIERVQHCVIECEPRLARLFARSFPRARVVPRAQEGAAGDLPASPDIVHQVHAGSLPKFFRSRREAFPHHNGYLRADAERVEAWRRKVRGYTDNKRVIGIAWSGGLKHTRRSLRSIPPAELAPLLSVPGVELVSLQHDDDDGSGAAGLAALGAAPVHAFPDALRDIDETAALMKSLDAVLTVCSTVVHLAGALGVPTLVLTPRSAEWRYLREGERLPWYPSVRLLRQERDGEWGGVIEQARAALLQNTSGAGSFDRPADA